MADPKFSKYKYILGEQLHSDKNSNFQGLQLPIGNIEGNTITANTKFFATPWPAGGGGAIMVQPTNEFKRFELKNLKFISGHQGAIHDLQFSPFHDNILASASNDTTVKIWMIPENGIQEDTAKFDANLAAHAKRVALLQFHPTSEFTLATASNDCSVKIWDIQNEKPHSSYDNLVKDPFCMQWNYDGSRLALITKEKKMHILDPRCPDEAQITTTHENIKAQRIAWLGDSGNILTQGFNSYSERQYAIFDSRNLESPLTMKKLDKDGYSNWLHYDDSSRVLYVVNKQNNSTLFFYHHETGADGNPWLQQIDSKFVGKESNRGVYFLPKRNVNFMKNELERAIRHDGKSAEFVSFKVKRQSGAFQTELFPPCRAQEPALQISDWLSGVNKPPIMQEFNSEAVIDNSSAEKRQHDFKKKMTLNGNIQPVKFSLNEDDGLNDQVTADAVKEATEPLNKKIIQLEETVASQAALIEDLRRQMKALEEEKVKNAEVPAFKSQQIDDFEEQQPAADAGKLEQELEATYAQEQPEQLQSTEHDVYNEQQ